ncbi:MAG TPA: FHA domain-containing protein [Polyangiaceae bacterium]|nr:FHA domain-containing protein [Polyangiaceae bacterium]
MTGEGNISALRAQAARVAAWLVDKQRPDEAVALLSAWAANGPSDPEGQQLLAQALRIDPGARIAQLAFERMEGMAGDHAALGEAVARYAPAELAKLDAEMKRPSFRRAQMGFNNNIKFRSTVFHVQTEDSGLDQPHIITHLFADGGRVIKSHKRAYNEHVSRPDVAEYVRGLMKAQHLEMVMALRDGRFDGIIAGREIGGVSLLTEAPTGPKQRPPTGNTQKAEGAPASGRETPPPAPAPAAAAVVPPPAPAAPELVRAFVTLHVLRSLSGGPERYDPAGTEALIGSQGAVQLPGEQFCHPREARLSARDSRLWLEDLEGGNGVFLRIRTPVELELGDEFVVGDQLLRIEKNPVPDDGPDPAPTYFYSSPKWPSSFRVLQIFEGGANGCCVVARGNTLQVGSAIGDLVFPDDPLVGEQHCLIEEQAGTVVITDLGSRTGVFVRVRGEQELSHGDELLIGRTRLVVDFPRHRAA